MRSPSPVTLVGRIGLWVTIASATFPRYYRSLNTGGDNERDTRYVVAQRILPTQRNHRSCAFP